MFELSDKFISTDEILNRFDDPAVGGVAIFEGRVRNHNEGKRVRSLEYEVFEEMALSVGQQIVEEAKLKFNLEYAYCIHFYGHLKIKDKAVVVIAGGRHRKEAFMGAQYIIDTVKDTVPIWKKEHYVDNTSEWVACHGCQKSSRHHEHVSA